MIVSIILNTQKNLLYIALRAASIVSCLQQKEKQSGILSLRYSLFDFILQVRQTIFTYFKS